MAGGAAPEAFNALTAFWVPFGAAALGGVLSAIGAVVAIAWQSHEARKTSDAVAKDLFLHLLVEQSRLLTKVEQYRSSHAGDVSYLDVDKIQANYNIFDRNREWLVRLRNEALRSTIADTMSEVQVWAFVTRNAYSDLQNARNVIAVNDYTSPSHSSALKTEAEKTQTLNVMFAELPRLRAACDEAARTLKTGQ